MATPNTIPGIDGEEIPKMPYIYGDTDRQTLSRGTTERLRQEQEAQLRQEAMLNLSQQQNQAKQDEQTGRTLAVDAYQWAQHPDYQGKSFAQATKDHPEVADHFSVDRYGKGALDAAEAWNQAQTKQTGVATGQPVAPITPAMHLAAAKAGFAPIPGETADQLATRMATAKAPAEYEDMSENERAIVDKIAKYEMPPPTNRGGMPPESRARIMGALATQYPEYDAKEYQSRQASLTGFKEGPEAKNITSANTTIGHLGALSEAAKNLGNSSTLPGITNPTRNIVGNITSADRQKKLVNFNSKANAAASELAKVFTGNVPAMQQIREWRSTLDPNMAPEAMQQSITSAIELLGSRLTALNDQWEKGAKGPRTEPFLKPESVKILRALGADPEAIDPLGTKMAETPTEEKKQQQPGTIPTINSQAEYDALPKGASYTDSTGKTAVKR